ncbi:helix-turn-helix domain-containing protein [Mucisphaera calidilacus]|uniref:LexA repressor n=1 Tax=Mucisphaera calidilacus TaxID=2527982 RepID=A0A518C0M7_9BACT|nr:XRE family transcriptional regulator [Mucisphaera calidilacus]QDU72774.1 LexA repressor [Mucisphaera calidilacus]
MAVGGSSSDVGLGELLRGYRRARGLSLSALAGRCGVTKGYLSLIENGRVGRPPSERVVSSLEEALGLTDGSLRRAAAWATTPEAIRAEVDRLRADASFSHRLARTLLAAGGKSGAGPVDLDALYRAGVLGRVTSEGAAGEDAGGAAGGRAEGGAGGDSGGAMRLLTEAMAERVPLINRVPAGYPAGFTDLGFPARVADEYVPCPGVRDRDAFAARVVGDSMEPEYREGDVVVFSPESDVVDGCDCFVRLEPDHETTFKRVFFDGEGEVRLQPLNPRYPARVLEREQVAGLYRAVWRMSRL